MKNDEFGVLPPEEAPLGDEFNAAKTPFGEKKNSTPPAKAAGAKRKQLKFLMKMFAGTAAAVVVINTTPGWQILTEQRERQHAQAEASVGAEESPAYQGGAASSEPSVGNPYESGTEESNTPAPEQSEPGVSIPETSEEEASATEPPASESEAPALIYCGSCYGIGLCLTCHGNRYVQCETIRSDCALCKGSGVRLCSDCEGTGLCAECGGSGKGTAIAALYKQCGTCEGRGILCGGSAAADDPEGCHGSIVSNCKACGGTGLENGKPCSWCKGTLKHLCPSFEVHRACPDCGGLGVVP